MNYSILVLGWLTLAIVAGLTFPIVSEPEAWYEFPFIPTLGEKARILFFHVPAAWITTVAFVLATVYGVKYLRSKNLDDDVKSVSAAGVGVLFCVLATVTGSIWAKFSWGSFWNWDPRETSIAVLLLIYGAYFGLRSAIEGEEKRARLSAVYAILAGMTTPFLIFVIPRLVASLHPEPIVNTGGKVHMNATMLAVFFASLIGFTGLFAWMFQLKVRVARLENSYL